MILKINDIKVGQRVRDKYGDMESLANSIREHGLLHPIVVDSDYNLIAGCRRLLACERIGLKEIEAKVLEDISEKELRILELEMSKNLVKLAEIKEKELAEKVNNSFHGLRENLGGRPPSSVVPIKEVSEEIGVPPQTLRDAKQHVKAVEEYPELSSLPKYKAMETAKELREAPPEEREKILDFAQRKAQTPSGQKEKDPYSYIEDCARLSQSYNKAMYAFLRINADEKEFKMISDVLAGLPGRLTVESYIREIDDTMNKLVRIRNFMKGVIGSGKNKDFGN